MSPAAPAASAGNGGAAAGRRRLRGAGRHRPRGARRARRADRASDSAATAAVGIALDVTDEASVVASFRRVRLAFGGIDIVVSNAGIASAAPVEDTTSRSGKEHGRPRDRLFPGRARGVPADARQQSGGAIVFVASKNGLAASAGASAYCTAKAAEIHLARCLALEGAPHGIRVNTVNPDAVLRGSRIWGGEWREQRAASNKMRRGRARGGLSPALAAEAAVSSPRTSPRRSISSPAISRPNRPATSSMSMPATRRPSRAETPIVGRQ